MRVRGMRAAGTGEGEYTILAVSASEHRSAAA